MIKKITLPLMLASASPRRRKLLADLGFDFEHIAREGEEIIPPGMQCTESAEYLAKQKMSLYEDLCKTHIVITADTVVCLDKSILGKPNSKSDAIEMIRSLSGKSHTVITGVCLCHNDKFYSFKESTSVTFRELSDAEILYYVETYKPFDKAGSYGIQEWIGMVGIENIQGDFYNVMGLPVSKLYQAIIQFSESF